MVVVVAVVLLLLAVCRSGMRMGQTVGGRGSGSSNKGEGKEVRRTMGKG